MAEFLTCPPCDVHQLMTSSGGATCGRVPERMRSHCGLTLYFQYGSPGKDKESNWLPAPKGWFMVIMRLYWPKEAAWDGAWKAPDLQVVE